MPGFGVFTAKFPDNGGVSNICLKYYPGLFNMTDKDHAQRFKFRDFMYLPTSIDSCDPDDPVLAELGPTLKDKFIMFALDEDENNCTLVESAQNLAKFKVAGIMTDGPIRRPDNGSDYTEDIIVASLYQRKDRDGLEEMMKHYPDGTFYLFAPRDDPNAFDSSLGVILMMAVVTVAFGSAWSGYAKKSLWVVAL